MSVFNKNLIFFTDLVTEIGTNAADMQPHEQTQLDNMDVLQITDYCPEWAFPEVCEGWLLCWKLFNFTVFISREVLRY